jgi:hypothetical protein
MALEYDTAAAEQLSALSVRERVAPLQGLLASSPRRLAVLLQYVLYADTDIQLEVRMVKSSIGNACVCSAMRVFGGRGEHSVGQVVHALGVQ